MAAVESSAGEVVDPPCPRGDFPSRLLKSMTAYRRELCFVVALLFTAYAALHNSPLKTQKIGVPKKFFPWNSLVTEYYLGHIHHAFEKVSESDLSFIMYYSPWDAVSMDVRWEFDKTARYYHNEVCFMAINCWWSEGECRNHFQRIQSYPVLMLYPGIGQGIQYRGPYSFVHLIRFLENVINPMTPVFSQKDLIVMQAQHDTVVLGYFNFEKFVDPPGFKSFYIASIKALERDPNRGVGFGVVSSSEVSKEFNFNASKSILLFRINDTLAYNKTFRSDLLLKWLWEKRSPYIQWLVPTGVKSLQLSSILEKSDSALILFTPYNPLSRIIPYFELLREVAMKYFTCTNSSILWNLRKESQQLQIFNHARHHSETNRCLPWILKFKDSSSGPDNEMDIMQCCHSVVVQKQHNETYYNKMCSVCISPNTERTSVKQNCPSLNQVVQSKLFKVLEYLLQSLNNMCNEFISFYNPLELVEVCCENTKPVLKYTENETFNIIYNKRSSDDFSESSHLRSVHNCRRNYYSEKYTKLHFPVVSYGESLKEFSGLGCRTNSSLTFLAIDSLQYGIFPERLGVQENFRQNTAVIIQNAQETHYLLKDTISKQSLENFIWNYTYNHLQRHLRTVQTFSLKNCAYDICITDVTTTTFEEIVLNKQKDVVLLYYAPWCGFCAGISHIFLSVAKYFQVNNDLVFARINGDNNDLPWEFTVDKYPSIIFFPAYRKSDSQKYPSEVSITVSSLIQFVFSNIQDSSRIESVFGICSEQCLTANRKQTLTQIQELLREVRIFTSRLHYTLLAEEKKSLQDENHQKFLSDYKKYLLKYLHHTKTNLAYLHSLYFFLSTVQKDDVRRRELQEFLKRIYKMRIKKPTNPMEYAF